MTNNDPGWLTMVRNVIPWVRGVPGDLGRDLGGASGGREGLSYFRRKKRVIKQQNNGSKPCFQVPKVCPDTKGIVFIHIWYIWGHCDELQQRYLVKTQFGKKKSSEKKNIFSHFHRPPGAIFDWFLNFPETLGPRTQGLWKIAKKKLIL